MFPRTRSPVPNPVQARDILPRLFQLWDNGLSRSATKGPAKIGVCVSGGPDSMALAYLLKQVPNIESKLRIEPFAFIVNHNARPGSHKEAKWVQHLLEKIDIKSIILNMEWPETDDPARLPDFESHARESRYQLIAEAAIRRHIRHLFLGHHKDDQIETILMRLLRNSTGSSLGLQGMPEESGIPCCENIRGAHEMQSYERFPDWLRRYKDHVPRAIVRPLDTNLGKGVTMAYPSGLRLHRPLLPFSKKQLIDTCKTNDIAYVNDKTNHDPTLTLRNAIRHLRNNYNLPRALQETSVLQLRDWAHQSAVATVRRGTELLRMIKIRIFDLRSGMLMIGVPQEVVAACKNDPAAGANALARLTGVITPRSREDIPTLVPRSRLEEFLEKMQSSEPEVLNVQRVLLEKICSISDMPERESLWRLSRQPMRSAEVMLAKQNFPPEMKPVTVGEESPGIWTVAVDKEKGLWSKWILWDHRYWVRVRTRNSATLSQIHIRPYHESDLEKFTRALEKEEKSNFHQILAQAAPGSSRYTLPVLTYQDKLSIFPTLNVMGPKSASKIRKSRLTHHPILEWEVCYKAIDQTIVDHQVKTIVWRNVQVQRH
ncbi:tRNA(Ile)-lysidine synthetase [Rhinocladiella mackenziei CBS 650.93]|uniref:tRNA(Ile)-lysidine synthetase n=1 Tax=Rhinocladiella mackenziei CBS 650.93 TaxID=1442369 RepID=A0A0D2GNH0_9EURO|nr:tRNA(Ile)-lysidine synthetase [Rhinocladiella mackenziei CBS 650.93]KIW99912.1 tRNA(Ile)-lysidine synthetase [Rhinocladiella mackenziei CBS 650.93]